MKKILINLMTIGVVMALMGTGVYALFSDTETSTGNSFTAGTLNLIPTVSGTGPVGKYVVTAGGDGVNGNVVFSNLVPGESGSITWALNNNGTIAGTLTMLSTAVFTENSSNEPEAAVGGNNGGGNGDLDDYLMVWLTRDGTDILGTSAVYVASSGLKAVLDAESRALAASGTITYVLSWKIDSGTGNIIQSDAATFGITFTLDQ